MSRGHGGEETLRNSAGAGGVCIKGGGFYHTKIGADTLKGLREARESSNEQWWPSGGVVLQSRRMEDRLSIRRHHRVEDAVKTQVINRVVSRTVDRYTDEENLPLKDTDDGQTGEVIPFQSVSAGPRVYCGNCSSPSTSGEAHPGTGESWKRPAHSSPQDLTAA